MFDGERGPYGESDRTNPISYYGRTKLASENVLRIAGTTSAIIRTMVLYGTGQGVKPNFALWLYSNLKEGKQIRVVDDQTGNPTLADDLALAILKIVELEKSGLYHIAGADIVSRYNFALSFAKIFGFNKKLIQPVKSSQFKQPAPRPLKSGFITLKAEVDLGLKMSGVERGLTIFKSQLEMISGEDSKS